MLLLLDRLESQGVVSKRILNIAEICLVRDQFFASGCIIELGTKLFSLLIVCHVYQIALLTLLSSILNITFRYIGKPFVDEATELESCEVLQRMVWW